MRLPQDRVLTRSLWIVTQLLRRSGLEVPEQVLESMPVVVVRWSFGSLKLSWLVADVGRLVVSSCRS